MDFRARLRVFFVLLVIVPMIALAVVLFTITSRSETAKADAAIAGGMHTAFTVYEERAAAATPALRAIASDTQLGSALTSGKGIQARLRALIGGPLHITSVELRAPGSNKLVARAGSLTGMASKAAPVVAGGRNRGTLVVSVTDAGEFARRVWRLTGYQVAVFRHGQPIGATLADLGPRSVLGTRGKPHDFNFNGNQYRVRVGSVQAPGRAPLDFALFRDTTGLKHTIARNRLVIGALLLGFLLLAILAASTVSRALTQQIDKFLVAARRLARGDFRQPVPVEGHDEFAQLGREFNSMSEQLASKIEEVKRQRGELSEAIRRVGDALAMGLDRNGVVALAVRTAVDACEAEAGRAQPVSADAFSESSMGTDDPELDDAMRAAERRAAGIRLVPKRQSSGRPGRMATPASVGTVHSLAVPMLGLPGSPEYLGVLSIARRRRQFSREEEELLQYLAGQAVVSIENARLHETVERQAVTDELTGLANLRSLHTTLESELERSRRFGAPLALVMLDLDYFKQINDTYGHQQGDEVLELVADVLRDFSRDIDTAARYGGEELAVVLPETDMEGAEQLAERMREAIEQLSVPRVDARGVLHLKASFGVAAVPESATDRDSLIAAADAALYRAKRGGRNRVERADPVAATG